MFNIHKMATNANTGFIWSTLLKNVWSGKVMDFYAPTARVISTEIMISLIFKKMINLYFQFI